MPLLSYFVVVGSALTLLLYLASTVLLHDTPISTSRNFEAPSLPRQPQHPAAVPASRSESTASFAAVPVEAPTHVEQSSPKFNAPPSPVTQNKPGQTKRKPVPRKREGRQDFRQTKNWGRDDRPRTDRRRRNNAWPNQGWNNPFWDSNWRSSGWH